MSTITNRKITDGQRNAVWVQHQQDRLTGTPQENKSVFDEYAELIREHFNGAMDDIDDALGDVSTDFGQIEERVEALEEINVEEAAISARAYAESARDYASMVSDELAEATSYASKHFKMTRSSGEGVPFAEFIFNPYGYYYSEDDYYEVFVNGFKLNENEYSVIENAGVNTSIVRLSDPIEETGNVIEVCVTKFLDPATYVAQAQEYAEDAEASREDAEGWAGSAYRYAEQAEASATSIGNVEERIREVSAEVHNYRDDAEEFKGDAYNYASNANTYASNASASATQAQTYAGNASTSAGNAQTYAGNASTSATQASGYATDASASATSAEDSAEDSEAWAVGQRGGVDVPSTDPAYENNAKYWAGQAEDLKDATQAIVDEARADVFEAMDGLHEETTAGSALQLISDKYTENKEPYLFRKSIAGDRELDTLVGGSVAWNQLVPKNGFSTGTNNGITFTNNGDGSITVSGTATDNANKTIGVGRVINHVYFLMGCPNGGSANTFTLGITQSTTIRDFGNGCIWKATSNNNTSLAIFVANGVTMQNVVFKPQLFDLTAMFGTAVADRLYQMEQANAGSGVALFRSWFPKDYYAYNTGELMSVKTSAHEMVGFNLLDESLLLGASGWQISNGYYTGAWNAMFVKYNQTGLWKNETGYTGRICISWVGYGGGSGCRFQINYTDGTTSSSSITATERHEVLLSTAGKVVDSIGVNYSSSGTVYLKNVIFSFDSDRNGEYQPYTKHTYALDDVELRGVAKLDSTDIYFDGDTYEADGTVTRKYGVRAYQSGDESLADAVTDGTNTVYKLATPTTETADPFTSPQIVDAYGTERYVDERTIAVPVGHVTKYPDNLREKLDGLPWDFSSLIAPTEKAYTATRNYTTGSLLIVNNILYKVTANIANGGAITPNTNVTATTLSEVISAL